MKKILLMAAVVLLSTANVLAQAEDVTPAGYKDWVGGTDLLCTKWAGKANITTPVTKTLKDKCGVTADQLTNGLIAFGGAIAYVPEFGDATKILQGVSVVDLGGKIGKVWALNGANSTAGEYFGIDLPKMDGTPGWFNMNIFMNPNNTPKSGAGNQTSPTSFHIRVKLVMNVFSATPDEATNIYNTIYAVHNDGAMIPAASNTAVGTAVTTGEFTSYDDEEEITKYDPTKWLVYEFDTWCPVDDAGASDGTYAPLRLKMEVNAGAMANSTIFIKEVSFTKVDGPTEIAATQHNHSYIKLDTSTGINSLEQTKADNVIYNIAGQRVSHPQKGLYIMNGKKFVKK